VSRADAGQHNQDETASRLRDSRDPVLLMVVLEPVERGYHWSTVTVILFIRIAKSPCAGQSRRRGMARLTINGQAHTVDVEPDTPLLWVIRENVGLTGTKYGCGIAQCGACTVHVDGVATRSCSLPVSAAEGKQITTIEGLAQDGTLHPVQKAWLDGDVPQCGYCQSGMIMAVAALLREKPKPTDSDIDKTISNICRCGTYQQVRQAIHTIANA